MKIYLISLERDKQRRNLLKNKFPDHWDKFTWVKAIDASDTKNQIIANNYASDFPQNARRPLSLGEKCCAISHIQCLQYFLETDDPYCIIIEDDIEGCDTDFIEALSIVKKLPSAPAVVVLGGQQGMKNAKHLSGYLQDDNFWEIPEKSIPFLTRACCYALNRGAAKKLLKSQSSCLRRSDVWEYYFKLGVRFFYSDILKHPIDLKQSRLESDRNIGNLFSRVLSDGFYNILLKNHLKLRLTILKLTSHLKKVTIKN